MFNDLKMFLFSAILFFLIGYNNSYGQDEEDPYYWHPIEFTHPYENPHEFFSFLTNNHYNWTNEPWYQMPCAGVFCEPLIDSRSYGISISGLWVSKDRKKFRAQFVYSCPQNADTSENYFHWPEYYSMHYYDPSSAIVIDSNGVILSETITKPEGGNLNVYIDDSLVHTIKAPAGKRIIAKTVNDSLFVFPWYWDKNVDSINAIQKQITRIKNPNGAYCSGCGVGYCPQTIIWAWPGVGKEPPKSKKLIKKFLKEVNPCDTFEIVDYLNINTKNNFVYYKIGGHDYRAIPKKFRDKEKISYLPLDIRPTHPIRFDSYRQAFSQLVISQEDTIKQLDFRLHYKGNVEPKFVTAYSNDKAVKLDFKEEKLRQNQYHHLTVSVDPSIMDFDDSNEKIVEITLLFGPNQTKKFNLFIKKNNSI